MTTLRFFRFCILFALSCLIWQPLKADLAVSMDAGVFNSPESPYVELSIYVYGTSLSQAYYDAEKSLRGVSTLVTIFQGDSLVKADKFNLISPPDSVVNFMDIKRYPLQPGYYKIHCEFVDLTDSTNTSEGTSDLFVQFDETKPQFSSLQMLASASKSAPAEHLLKNGLYLEQLPFGFYHKDLNKLYFYSELYNLNKLLEDKYYVTYSVVTADNRKKEMKKGHKRLKEQLPMSPILVSFDISDLGSGNYNLILSLHKGDQTELDRRRVFFQRSNPHYDATAYREVATTDFEGSFVEDFTMEEMKYSLKAIAPLVPPADVEVLNILIKNKELKSMRFYLNRYWKEQSAADPRAAYDAYMEVAGAIDKMFNNGFGYGFETDRGYIYLKYGKPDDIISVLDEPSAFPYEIWVYNSLNSLGQSHVKFLFFNETLADNDYELLHSTAIGEVQNPRWEVVLYGSAPGQVNGSPVNSNRMQDNFGRNARRLFEEN